MKLLEHEGKRLFARHGIAVPKGGLWPDLPAGCAGYVVKAQVRAGGRGKGGGIHFAGTAAEAGEAAGRLLGSALGGHAVTQVYVEERLDVARELYLAVVIDRDARAPVILASPEGGVEIEAVASERVLRLPVDPLIGLRPFMVRRLGRFLEAPAGAERQLEATVEALYGLALGEDAELAEINPLVVTAAGDLVAADAKVTLDARARFRHPDWAAYEDSGDGSEIERAIAGAGAAAAELDPEGDVVGVISGAGLMMATLDMMIALGVRVRCVIDMGGTPLGGAERLIPIFRAVAAMRPKVTFVNAYFHTALSDSFARGVIGAAEAEPLSGRLILRLVGRNAQSGRDLLTPLGFELHDGLMAALEAVAEAARRPA
jgi:succinyl-CoA synthetase beta subunit